MAPSLPNHPTSRTYSLLILSEEMRMLTFQCTRVLALAVTLPTDDAPTAEVLRTCHTQLDGILSALTTLLTPTMQERIHEEATRFAVADDAYRRRSHRPRRPRAVAVA